MATKKMGKLDRMGVAESELGELDASEEIAEFQEIVSALETFDESREEAIAAFADAMGYHEEKDWESRDESLEEAASAIGRMDESLSIVEDSSYAQHIFQLSAWRNMVNKSGNHINELI